MKPVRYSVLFAILALVSLASRSLPAAGTPAAEDAVVETASAEKLPINTPLVDGKIRQLMQDRDYSGAIKEIDKELAKKDAPKDYLTYLKGRALYLQKQYDAAVATFDSLQEEFPQSPWCRRARFGKAVALARKGDFRAAELIYRSEAEYLLSTERKQELADIYLEFADTYFKPPKEDQKPDYNKALQFYNKALEVGPKPEKRIEVELLVAQCYQNLKNKSEAAKRYEKFIKKNPDSPLDIEARYRLGQCRLAEDNAKKARRVWQDMLAKHDDSKSERIAEATFNLSRTWSIPKPGNDEQLSLGTAALEAFIKRFPDHKLAGKAHLDIAQSFVHRGRYEDAVESLKRFLAEKRYADRDEVPDARNLLGRSYQLQKKFTEALATWHDYLAKHPAHKAWSSAQREIINTEYLMAHEKMQEEDYDAAEKLFGKFLAKYPLDGRNPAILLLVNRKYTKAKKWDEAIANWRRLVSKYPRTNEASQAQYLIAQTLEKELGKLEEALEEYRKVTWGSMAGRARQAQSRLVAKSMTISTERPFRSDEKPTLKLTTRNIESLTVRAYKVDMETYFRKMHLASGVEALDIALIDPDSTFEFKVPDYAKYAQLQSEIEVPLPDDLKAGVMAVTVSSKTLEATTLVVQSDLDIVVKSSRDEVFVFAENMLSGEKAADVRLLISDGKKVFAEETTGPDGVLQKSFEELKKAGDVRVFAMKDGNMASNVVSLSGVGVAVGLADKGYIYTDRPAYKAGQMVHVRGCLRHAVDDKYTIEKDKKYTVEVFDGRNRLLRQEEISLNPFGSFHTHFVLPPTSPQGTYRVLVRDTQGKQNYQGKFLVHQYKLEPMHVTIDTPRKVYYRGEEIEGTIRAAYYYGAPLAGREVRYQLAGERMHTATTDEKGEVKFKLPTREFGQSQLLTMQVTLPERNLRTAANFMLATQGFSVGLKTVRPVYVAGETFEVTVNANDAEGSPVGKKLTLKVLERTKVRGKVGERLVEEHEIETDEKDGTARATLKLDEGGQYLIRAEGTDRFGNPISGQYAVKISDDKDSVRLRILADHHSFKTGDTAKVNLHWREEPALALVTFQGARVLDYKLIELKNGANELDIPMTAQLAPNFDLAIAVMTDPRGAKRDDKPMRRFHQASSPFMVERDLRVKIATKRADDAKGPVRPGEMVEVTVTTTDPQGKPVSAELSLAMVEQALLERFPPQVAGIKDFFRGTRRQSALRTTSSVTFAYRPATRHINANLLSERDRIEVAREEAESLRGIGMEMRTGDFADSRELTMLVTPRIEIEEEAEELFLQDGPRRSIRSYTSLGTSVIETTTQRMGRVYNSEPQFRGSRAGNRRMMVRPRVMLGVGVNSDSGSMSMGGIIFDKQNCMVDGRTLTASNRGGFYYAAPDVANLNFLAGQNESGVQVILYNGATAFVAIDGRADLEGRGIEELSRRLTAAGAVLLLGMSRQETAYWNPSVTTDEKGTATLKLTMPEKSTAWKLLAKGITTETLAGEDSEKIVVKKDLFGQLKLPTAFTDGDKAQIMASIHNGAIEKGPIEVTLTTTIAGRSIEEKKTIEVDGKGIEELVFKITLDRPEKLKGDQSGGAAPRMAANFELTISAAGQKDVTRRSVPLLPDGVPVYATASGSASSDTTAWVEAPKDMPLDSPSMQIIVGPTVERSLLDIVFGSAPSCQMENARFTTGMESSTADLLASLGLQQLLSKTRDAGSPEADALDGRIRASIGLIVSAQNDDGGFSWTGRGGASGRYGSSRIVWALSKAKKAGYNVPEDTYNKALNYLRKQVAATANNAYESKAILLHALSTAGRGDFALANRLHRSRAALSPAALAHLVLALVEMDRKATAAELLEVIGQRNFDATASRRKSAQGSLPWSHSPAELRALYALALQEVTPGSPKAKQQVDWLLAHRTGHRWTPDKATGPATVALCRWFATSRFEGGKYKLAVFVNDVKAKELEIDASSGTQVIDVPDKLLGKGKQRVNFQITGRGRYTYQCILGGFVPSGKLKSTAHDWRVTRIYEPALLEVEGREIPRGFGVLRGSYSSFRNPLTQLPIGRRGLVELKIYRHNISSSTPQQQFEYLVVTEPIPSGTTVIEKSVKGPFERFEIGPGAITFYIGSRRSIGTIRYQLHGYLPGEYRAGPTVIRNAHRPEQLVVAGAKSLAVLPKGRKSKDKYRLTPQELYELGKLDFGKKRMAAAGKHLTELLEKWNLNDNVYKHAVTMLLDVHLESGPPAKVVHYFEIIKEKWPAEEIPFDKIVKVGAAYHEMGEYERSYLVFRATVEGSFTRESGVAGFLQGQGEFVRSIGVMGRLLREYPPESYVAAASYALAQQVYAKAPQAAGDAKLRKAKINRVDLIRRAWTMLESFMTAYPADPAADQAAFSAANALLELKAYKQAAEACHLYAQRYPKSDLLDSYWYMIGYCHFATSENEAALEMCRKVAEHVQKDEKTGRTAESANKWRAIYILGQVHHSLGQAAEAIKEYQRVEDRFADARQSIEYFTRKQIELPEVTTVKPHEKAEVELSFRNIAACDTKVYRIDLMKFSLLKRSLGGITQINLAGIRPHHEETIELGDGKDYKDCTHKLTLPLKEEGAYLVVCRGENLHTSGLVLVTPLGIEVREDRVSGRVRTTVKDLEADKYVRDVHVKVIGSSNSEFKSGSTDLRGVFVADSIRGTTTVIAQTDNSRYAFFRGETYLGKQKQVQKRPLSAASVPASGGEGELLKGLKRKNLRFQREQDVQLQDMYDSDQKGVEAQKVF